MGKKLIQWSAALGAGIVWMDYQHQTLIEKINALYAGILEKKGEAHISVMIVFLDEYVRGHFSFVVKYMENFSYPERYEHCQAHEQFRKNLEELKLAKRAMGELEAEALCYDLFEWFQQHIKATDKKLGIFLKTRMEI